MGSLLQVKWKCKGWCYIQNCTTTKVTNTLSQIRTNTFSEISVLQENSFGEMALPAHQACPDLSEFQLSLQPVLLLHLHTIDKESPSFLSQRTLSTLSCFSPRNTESMFLAQQLNVWLVIWDKWGFMLPSVMCFLKGQASEFLCLERARVKYQLTKHIARKDR